MSLVVCVIVIHTDRPVHRCAHTHTIYTCIYIVSYIYTHTYIYTQTCTQMCTHTYYIYIHIYMKQIYQKQIFFELPLWAVWLFNRYSFLVVPECLFSMVILKDRVFYLILFKEKDDLTFYA